MHYFIFNLFLRANSIFIILFLGTFQCFFRIGWSSCLCDIFFDFNFSLVSRFFFYVIIIFLVIIILLLILFSIAVFLLQSTCSESSFSISSSPDDSFFLHYNFYFLRLPHHFHFINLEIFRLLRNPLQQSNLRHAKRHRWCFLHFDLCVCNSSQLINALTL